MLHGFIKLGSETINTAYVVSFDPQLGTLVLGVGFQGSRTIKLEPDQVAGLSRYFHAADDVIGAARKFGDLPA